jgi:ribonuclease P protein component
MPKFPKEEKLCSRKLIGELFESGKKVKKYPMVLIYKKKSELERNQITFSVPKRRFKKAVDRNKIKRLLREVYRLNKDDFFAELNLDHKLAMFLVYNSDKMPTYKEVETNFILILERLKNELSKQHEE